VSDAQAAEVYLHDTAPPELLERAADARRRLGQTLRLVDEIEKDIDHWASPAANKADEKLLDLKRAQVAMAKNLSEPSSRQVAVQIATRDLEKAEKVRGIDTDEVIRDARSKLAEAKKQVADARAEL